MIKALFSISDSVLVKLTKEDLRMISAALHESLQELKNENGIHSRMGFSKAEVSAQHKNVLRIYRQLTEKRKAHL